MAGDPAAFETPEYFGSDFTSSPGVSRNWALGALNASSAYAAGATGAGITIAVVDTGIDSSHPELAGRISPLSTDIVAGRDDLSDFDGHGTRVAGFIAANKDNIGMHGIAFNSQVMALRVDDSAPGGGGTLCDTDDACLGVAEIADAIDYAVANGAQIINLSLGGEPASLSSVFQTALQNAAAAGVLVVAASGNESLGFPSSPADFASAPSMLGLMVAVGSVDEDLTLSSFSNAAGAAIQSNFLVAPGSGLAGPFPGNLAPDDCGAGTNCIAFDQQGTSFATPYVAGSLALLLEAFPNIAPADALNILYDTAVDLGDPGADVVFGRGLVDLQAAFQPVGSSTVDVGGPGATVSAEAFFAPAGGAFGDWAFASGLTQNAILRDGYDRAFDVSAPTASVADLQAQARFDSAARGLRATTEVANAGPMTAAFRAQPQDPIAFANLTDAADMSGDMRVAFSFGAAEVAAGRGFSAPGLAPLAGAHALAPAGYGTAAFGASDGAWTSAALNLGGWRIGVTSLDADDTALETVGVSRTFGSGVVALETGRTVERDRALGSSVAARFGGADASETPFVAASWTGQFVGPWTASVRREWARPEISVAGSTTVLDAPTASAWSAGIERATRFGGVAFSLSQPLRAESGALSVDIARRVNDNGVSLFSRETAALTPSGREMALTGEMRFALDAASALTIAGRITDDPGHVASAEPEAALWFGWRAQR